MKAKYKIIILLLTLAGFKTLQGFGQVSAVVDLSRKNVYVQQPFRVNITVYTKTWFTAPLEFTNLQIPNAFIIPFDKTQPGMFTIGGTQYPGVQFYYIVFPYKTGEFTIPPLEIMAQSPPEGSSTARKVVIHTQEQHYIVKDVPKELKSKGAWFVAKDVSIKETWSPGLKNLKVGDVVKRSIVIEAKGTLPQFIPEILNQERMNWASVYPQSPQLQDIRTEGDVNGKSTQIITFLLEKPGNQTIPEVSLSYWNPFTGKINSVLLEKKNIQVADNPNLGILKTLEDSLKATSQLSKAVPDKKEPFLILGMKWYQFAGIMILCFVVCYFLFYFGKKLYKNLQIQRQNYLQSEPYLFKQFLKSGNDPQSTLPALYRWWDSLKHKPSASVRASLNIYHEKELETLIKDYLEKSYHEEKTSNAKTLKKSMEEFRERINQEERTERRVINEEQI